MRLIIELRMNSSQQKKREPEMTVPEPSTLSKIINDIRKSSHFKNISVDCLFNSYWQHAYSEYYLLWPHFLVD